MSFTDSWTSVGKYGKPVRDEFSAEAASAFGSRGSRGERGNYGGYGRSNFSESAAAAFGGSRRSERSDDRRSDTRYYAPPRFDARSEPKKPVVVEKPKTYEEAFPALGSAAGGGAAAAAKPAAAAAAATTTAPTKMSFATLVKKTAEEEAAAEELRRYQAQQEAEARRVEERQQWLISAIHGRTSAAHTPGKYEEEDLSGGYGEDLDHDAYGERATCMYGEVPEADDHYSDHSHGHEDDEY